MKSWYVYVLLNGAGIAYTGIAVDVDARLENHNAGTGAKFTRGRGPWRVVYAERWASKPEALRREIQVKRDRTLKAALKEHG